jgi:hypothetical protein
MNGRLEDLSVPNSITDRSAGGCARTKRTMSAMSRIAMYGHPGQIADRGALPLRARLMLCEKPTPSSGSSCMRQDSCNQEVAFDAMLKKQLIAGAAGD